MGVDTDPESSAAQSHMSGDVRCVCAVRRAAHQVVAGAVLWSGALNRQEASADKRGE
jgi:hypothetical protein